MSKILKAVALILLTGCIYGAGRSALANGSKDVVDLVGGQSIHEALDKINSMTKTTLQEFLDQADERANGLLRNALSGTSLLEIQTANSILNISSSITSQFGSELSKVVSSTSAQLNPFLVQLNRLNDSIDKLAGAAVGLEDLLALDILSLPLTNHALYVRRIYGGVLVKTRPETYYIDLFGPNFGAGAEGTANVKMFFDVSLDGKPLGSSRLIPPYDIIFSIPAGDLEGRFAPDKIIQLKAEIKVRRETRHWWKIFGPEVEEIKLPYIVSLLPTEVGKVTQKTRYPEFEWTSLPGEIDGEPKWLSETGLVGPYSAPNPAVGNPIQGNMRIDKGSIIPECIPDMRDARDFGKGRILPSTNEVFKTEFKSADSCGSKGDRDAAIASIRGKFDYLFNIQWNDNCQEGDSGHLSKERLTAASKSTTMDITACSDMTADKNIIWHRDATSFSVRVTGTPIDPEARFFDPKTKKTVPTAWRAKYRLQQYMAKTGELASTEKVLSVSALEPLSVDVLDYPGKADTILYFTPAVGARESAPVGQPVGNLKPDGGPTDLDGRRVYHYKFSYPDLNLNQLRSRDGLT